MKLPKIEVNKDTGIKVAKVAGGLVLGFMCAAFGAIIGKKNEKTEEIEEIEETEKTEEIEEIEETTVDEAEVEETNNDTEENPEENN